MCLHGCLHKNQPGIMSLFSSNKCNPWATLQYWLILQALLSIVSNHLAWCSSALSRTFCTVTRENQIRETVPGTFALHCGSHYLYFFIAHKISLASACKALASGNESLLHRVVPSLQMRSIQVTMEWWSSWNTSIASMRCTHFVRHMSFSFFYSGGRCATANCLF